MSLEGNLESKVGNYQQIIFSDSVSFEVVTLFSRKYKS